MKYLLCKYYTYEGYGSPDEFDTLEEAEAELARHGVDGGFIIYGVLKVDK